MRVFWNILAIISFFISANFYYLGYDKMNNYYSSESHPSLNQNVIVGGDAYNYIINANYATGFFVLALISTMSGLGFISLGFLDQILKNQKQQIEILENISVGAKQEDFEDLPEL